MTDARVALRGRRDCADDIRFRSWPPNGVISRSRVTLIPLPATALLSIPGASVTGLREQPQALARILKWNKLIISLRL
ncbi:hypothetical protein UA70_02910 [Raoultella planticola]|nr:hypothetical protein UA70_02910 [Raoultella planticola]